MQCYSQRWAKFVLKLYQLRSGRYIWPRTILIVACIVYFWSLIKIQPLGLIFDIWVCLNIFKPSISCECLNIDFDQSFVNSYNLKKHALLKELYSIWSLEIIVLIHFPLKKNHIYFEASFHMLGGAHEKCTDIILWKHASCLWQHAPLFNFPILSCRLPV